MPVLVLADQLLIGHKAQEGIAEARARDPMLLRDDAPSRSLAVGKGEKDYPLVAVQAIPDGLVRIRGLGQNALDVRRRLGQWQRWQGQGPRLAVERALVVREQRLHQGGLAAGKDVCRRLRVVLDDGANEAVEGIVGNQQVLELVEADDSQPLVQLEQRFRNVEKLEQCGAGLMCTGNPYIDVREFRASGRGGQFAWAAAEAGADQGVLVAGADHGFAVELLDRQLG